MAKLITDSFEYKLFELIRHGNGSVDFKAVMDGLNGLGNDGWEYTGTTLANFLLLKRKLIKR